MGNVSSPTDEWTPTPLDIPPHWEQIDFEDAFENISLSHLKIPQKEYLSSGTIPIVDQGVNLIGGFTNDASRSIRPNRALIVFGDHTKCFKLVGFRFAPGADGVKVLRPITINERFAYYACRALRLPDRGYSRHYAFLKKSKLPLAPQNEQIRIVAKIEELFSELDKGIESLKAARAKLNVYRQAVLKHAFEGKLTAQWREENKDKLETPEQSLARIKKEREARYDQRLQEWKAAVKRWEEGGKSGRKPAKPKKPLQLVDVPQDLIVKLPHLPEGWLWAYLSDISDVSGGLTKNQKRNSLPRKMKYLRVANVYADEILTDDIHEIGVTDSEAKAVALKAGDLLIVEGNGSIDQIGRVALWDGELSDCGHQNHLIRTRLLKNFLPRFFLQFLLSPLGRDLIVREASSTSGLHTLSISKVSNLVVPVASSAEESAVVAQIEERLSKVDKTLEDIDTQLVMSEALRQSILKNAFSGQLVPQDPDDEPASSLLERIKAEKAARSQNNTRAKRRRTTATA